MKYRHYILPLLAVVLSISACRKDRFEHPDSRDTGSAYFPLVPKMYHIYEVERIIFDAFNNRSDTLHFLLKEEQDTFFTDQLGRPAMRYVQSMRPAGSSEWGEERVYYHVSLKTHIESVIENQRYVRLTLPVIEESVWDFNTYNNSPQYLLFYNRLLDSYSNGFVNAGKSIEILRLGRDLPFEENHRREVYAEEIGLLSREYTRIENSNNRPSGVKERFELIEYGFD